MCSSRCEIPAWPGSSEVEPVAIQNPSATERTLGTRSVTTRTPESRVLMRCSSVKTARCSASIAVTPVAGAPRAALVAAARSTLGALASVACATIARSTAAAASAAAAGADACELLDGLAGDVGILCEAQADAPTLAVDLDHADVDLIALVEDVLDALDALAGGDVGDVQQAVGALGELDERAEGRRLHDLADVFVADLDLLHHHPHALNERVALLAVGRVDQNLAVVVDVDLGVELLGEAANRFAALADQEADLGRVDLDRLDARRELAELLARRADDVGHLAEDERARLFCLSERVAQDVERDARDLDVHLQRRVPALGARDLEVHVSEVILDAGDVGQDDVVLALLDQAHRDTGHRALDRHPGVHQRQRGATHGGHRGGAVGLEDVRDHADRVGELLDRGHHRRERPLGERAMADVTALDATHATGLPDREGREVVVVPVVLFRFQPERVDAHLLLEGAHRDDAQRLGLPAREQRRAVGPGSDADLDQDVADLVLGAAVWALLVHGDALADDPPLP